MVFLGWTEAIIEFRPPCGLDQAARSAVSSVGSVADDPAFRIQFHCFEAIELLTNTLAQQSTRTCNFLFARLTMRSLACTIALHFSQSARQAL